MVIKTGSTTDFRTPMPMLIWQRSVDNLRMIEAQGRYVGPGSGCIQHWKMFALVMIRKISRMPGCKMTGTPFDCPKVSHIGV